MIDSYEYEEELKERRKKRIERSKKRRRETIAVLSITSLCDILTVLLLFFVKNISMEGQQFTQPSGMTFPMTISTEELIKDGHTVIIKVFPDKIYLGSENVLVGTTSNLLESSKTRETLYAYMKDLSKKIVDNKSDAIPCLLIQADENVDCQYITEIVYLSASSAFANIYFSTIKAKSKEEAYKL